MMEIAGGIILAVIGLIVIFFGASFGIMLAMRMFEGLRDEWRGQWGREKDHWNGLSRTRVKAYKIVMACAAIAVLAWAILLTSRI